MNPLSIANTVIDECESTNDLVRALAESGAPQGTWISARVQRSGRGRLGREWVSHPGNLFLSIIARPKTFAWLSLAIAVGVSECLREMNPRLALQIKWPNDLWLEGKKVGGILCEASSGKPRPFVVVGIGLNCTSAPRGLDQETVALSDVSPITADEIRLPIVSSVMSALAELEHDGPRSIRERYERMAVFQAGMAIEWSSEGGLQQGTVRGLGESGELWVMTPEGQSLALYAEDVRVRPC